MELHYRLFAVGFFRQLACITHRGARIRNMDYPSLCALIRHPRLGNIVFGTGYSPYLFTATRAWPYSLYPSIVPVHDAHEQSLATQLQQQGIYPDDIQHIILAHFHADHIAGLNDFPKARIHCSQKSYQSVQHTHGFQALRKGFIPGLLPNDFAKRVCFIEKAASCALSKTLRPFHHGYDLFDDGSVIAIALPGHTSGQMGIVFYDERKRPVFLVANAAWSCKAIRTCTPPSRMSYFSHHEQNSYYQTLEKLHHLHRKNHSITIIPSHCQEVWQRIAQHMHV